MACHQWSEGNYAENNKPRRKKEKQKLQNNIECLKTINVSSGKTLFCVTKIPTIEKSLCHLKWLFALVNPFVFSHLKFEVISKMENSLFTVLFDMFQTEGRHILSSFDSNYFGFGNSFGFPFFFLDSRDMDMK